MQILLLAILYCVFSKNLKTPLVQPMMIKSEPSNESDNTEQNLNQSELLQQEILALPSSVTTEGDDIKQLALNGEKLNLDYLGPIIINTDGTTKRITNWDTLTKGEQATTWRVISARNKKRIEELKNEEQNMKNDDEEKNMEDSTL
jgi:hypothetical protein